MVSYHTFRNKHILIRTSLTFKAEQKIDHATERLCPKAISRDQKFPASAISRDQKLLFRYHVASLLVSISNHAFPLDP